MSIIKKTSGNLPGCPEVKTLYFHCREHRTDPSWETKMPQAAWPKKKRGKTGNNRCWQGWGETKILIQCLWECKMKKPLWKQFDSFDLVIPLLVTILRKMKTYVHMKMRMWMFILAPFITVKKCKQSRCHQWWINKTWYSYTMVFSVQFSCSVVSDSATPWTAAH